MNEQYSEKFDEAITRAWVDEDFRRYLIRDPKAALREAGVVLPESVKVTVHEFDPNDRHIFLPPWHRQEASPPLRRVIGMPVVRPAIVRPDGYPDPPTPQPTVSYGIARPFLRQPAEIVDIENTLSSRGR